MIRSIALLLCVAPAAAAGPSGYKTAVGELLGHVSSNVVVAVTELSYADGRESPDGYIVAERLTAELSHAQAVKAIERSKIEAVLSELKLQQSGVVDPSAAKDIGKLLGADQVIVGTLTELPAKQLELNLRMVSVESGEITAAATATVIRNWVTRKPTFERTAPISLGDLLAGKEPPAPDAQWIGSGCGYDVYYERDGSFMQWLRGAPHGAGGHGTKVVDEHLEYCNFVAYIEQRVEANYPELRDAWRIYKAKEGI